MNKYSIFINIHYAAKRARSHGGRQPAPALPYLARRRRNDLPPRPLGDDSAGNNGGADSVTDVSGELSAVQINLQSTSWKQTKTTLTDCAAD